MWNKINQIFSFKIYITNTIRVIFIGGFIPAFTFIIFYQFYLINIPGTLFAYNTGLIIFSICNSILAACVFYFIAQYVAFEIPEARRKIQTLSILNQYFIGIDEIIQQIIIDIQFENQNIKDINHLEHILENIKINSSVHDFHNWYKYFYHKKSQLQDLTRSCFYHNHFINPEIAREILILDQRLMDLYLFSGYKILANETLQFAASALQEVFIHNSHLQELRRSEFKKYEVIFATVGKDYRNKFYSV
jgi:hypothetical protein